MLKYNIKNKKSVRSGQASVGFKINVVVLKGKIMVDKTEEVVWKTYPGIYFLQANQFGEIRTVDHYAVCKDGRKYFVKGHILKQWLNHNGYLFVNFRVNGKKVNLQVHRVIATCFLPNPENLPEVNHKDNNPKNNFVSNLEFCSHEYNMAYKEKYGKSAAEVSGCPVFAVSLKTFDVLRFESQHEASRLLGVSQGSINRVLKDRRKQTGGYWFCYEDSGATEKTRAKFGDEVASEVEELINEKFR